MLSYSIGSRHVYVCMYVCVSGYMCSCMYVFKLTQNTPMLLCVLWTIPSERPDARLSQGCVFYELCTLRRPFEAESLPALILKIVRGKFAPIPTIYSSDLRKLVDLMIRINPDERFHVADILAQNAIQQQLRASKSSAQDQADTARDNKAAGTASPHSAASPLNAINPGTQIRRVSPEPLSAAPAGPQHHQPAPNRPVASDHDRRNKPAGQVNQNLPGRTRMPVKGKPEESQRPRSSEGAGHVRDQAPAAAPERRVLPPNITPRGMKDASGKGQAPSQNDRIGNKKPTQASNRPSSARSRSKERNSDETEVVSACVFLRCDRAVFVSQR
jgi:serine/threonine protein kinase